MAPQALVSQVIVGRRIIRPLGFAGVICGQLSQRGQGALASRIVILDIICGVNRPTILSPPGISCTTDHPCHSRMQGLLYIFYDFLVAWAACFVDHAQIGGHLAKNWQFPSSLVDSITYHHEINKAASNLHQLMIVHTADSIVNNHNFDSANPLPYSTPINPDAKNVILSNLEPVSEWFPDVTSEIESALEFFLAAEG